MNPEEDKQHPNEPLLEALLENQDSNAKSNDSLLEAILENQDSNAKSIEPILEAQLLKTDELVKTIKEKPEIQKVQILGLENLQGKEGPAGEKGEKGDTGPEGPMGSVDIKADGKVVKKADTIVINGFAGRDGAKGEKGDKGDTGPEGPKGPKGDKGKDGSPDTAIDIKQKLESLEGEQRLDVSAIKGLKELEKKVKNNESNLLYVNNGAVKSVTGSGVDNTDPQNPIINASSVGAFTDLTDVPNSYVGQGTKFVRVNGAETALEFATVSGGGDALTSAPLSQFAATTSAQLAGVISDETGSGSLVFGTDPTFTTRINVPELKATGAGGVDIHNNTGTQVALFGAGGGTGTSLVGTTNIGSASADYIQITGGTGATTFTATGSSTNIDITLIPKGSGLAKITGNLQISGLTASKVVFTDASKNLTSTGIGTSAQFIKGDGSLDSSTYITGNQTITLSGDVTGSGATSITTTIAAGAVDIAMLSATGTPSATTYLRGDNTWATISAGGDVTKVGTPVNNQIGVWTGDGTIEGDTALTFDTATDLLSTVNATLTGELTLPNTGLHLLDTNGTHDLIVAPGSNLTADRTLTVTTGDTNMILDLTAVTDEYVLAYDAGTNTWRGVVASGGSGTPGGSDTQIQFNDGGAFGGDAGLTYNKTTDTLTGVISAFTTSMTSPLIVGGSGTTQALTYKTTTGIGATGADHIFQVGNNGATEAMRIFNSGRVGFNDGSTEPTSQVAIINSSLTTTQSLTSGLVIENTTAATSGNQKISPALRLSGKGWKTTATAASQDVSFLMDVLPVQGTANPTGTLQFHTSINGGTITKLATIGSDGQFETFVASSGLASFKVDSTGTLFVSRTNSSAGKIYPADNNGTYASGGNGIFIGMNTGFGSAGTALITGLTGNWAHTTGSARSQTLRASMAPTSGTGTVEALNITGTINQTGGANGFWKASSVTPTLTAYADVRGYSMAVTSTISSATSPLLKGIDIQNTINHTGSVTSSNFTDIFINDTETSLTGTTHNFADFQIAGTTKFKITNAGAVLSTKLIEVNTAGSGSPNIITADESNTTYTNEGSTAKNYHTLPTAVAGLTFTFIVQDTDGIRVVANTGDTIRLAGTVSGAAGYTESTTIGDSVTLTAINATEWIAISIIGTWTTV